MAFGGVAAAEHASTATHAAVRIALISRVNVDGLLSRNLFRQFHEFESDSVTECEASVSTLLKNGRSCRLPHLRL
jgi:hypothetical protein